MEQKPTDDKTTQPTEQQSQLVKDMLESEEEFKKQFDPTSTTYHAGDPTQVPIGGNRIPKSMPSEFDDKAPVTEEIDYKEYGPEYVKLYETREYINEFKKVLARVCPPIEAVLRIKEKKLPQEKEEEQIKAEHEKLKAVLKEIQEGMEIIEKAEIDATAKKKVLEGLKQVCDDAWKDYSNKEDYTNYSFFVKGASSKTFQLSTKLLDAMKKIKKEKTPEILAKRAAAKQQDAEKTEEKKPEEGKDASKDV